MKNRSSVQKLLFFFLVLHTNEKHFCFTSHWTDTTWWQRLDSAQHEIVGQFELKYELAVGIPFAKSTDKAARKCPRYAQQWSFTLSVISQINHHRLSEIIIRLCLTKIRNVLHFLQLTFWLECNLSTIIDGQLCSLDDQCVNSWCYYQWICYKWFASLVFTRRK